MGIQGFNTFLRNKNSSLFKEIPLSSFKGKRIAIDFHNWLYTNASMAVKNALDGIDVILEEMDRKKFFDQMIGMLINFIIKFLKWGITPLLVMDGKPPEKKNKTREERRQQREKAFIRSKELKESLSKDILLIKDEDIQTLKSNIRQTISLSKDEITRLVTIVKTLGIPVIQAKEEGEQLCALLAIEGKVEAVFSTDTDTLAYGTPLSITKFAKGNKYKEPYVITISLTDVLKELKFSYPTFVDFCIMCGTDYNQNIKGIAAGYSYKWLAECKSIDKLPSQYDVTCLNHHWCREQFSYKRSNSLTDSQIKLDINKAAPLQNRSQLSELGIYRYYEIFLNLYKDLPSPSKTFISKPPNQIKIKL